jgi:hypothetical protein
MFSSGKYVGIARYALEWAWPIQPNPIRPIRMSLVIASRSYLSYEIKYVRIHQIVGELTVENPCNFVHSRCEDTPFARKRS